MKNKMVLKSPEPLWNRVKKFKFDNRCRDMNEAVLMLLEKGLGLSVEEKPQVVSNAEVVPNPVI